MIVFQHRIIFYIYLTAPVSEKDFPKFIDKYNRVDAHHVNGHRLSRFHNSGYSTNRYFLLTQTFAGESFVRVKKKNAKFYGLTFANTRLQLISRKINFCVFQKDKKTDISLCRHVFTIFQIKCNYKHRLIS